ncbi:hypothetical protein ACL1CI_09595, partial [Corynebacterium striatum]
TQHQRIVVPPTSTMKENPLQYRVRGTPVPTTRTRGTNYPKSTTATQKMLKDIGIDLKVEERPSSDFSEIATKKDFDIFPMGFTAGDPFGIAYFGQVYRSDSELNKSGTGTPEMDKKIEELAKIADPDEQIKKGNELEREALSTYGIMPIYNGPAMVATSPKLANFGAASFAVLEVEDIGYTE